MRYDYVSEYSDPAYGGFGIVQAVFRQRLPGKPDLEAAVPPDWSLFKKLIAPYNNSNGFRTALAIANASTYSNNELLIQIYDESGALLATEVRRMSRETQFAAETDVLWPVTAGRRGTITISSDGYGTATLVLLFNPTGSLTSSQFYERR